MSPIRSLVTWWREYWAKRLGVVSDTHKAVMEELDARVATYQTKAEIIRRRVRGRPQPEGPQQ